MIRLCLLFQPAILATKSPAALEACFSRLDAAEHRRASVMGRNAGAKLNPLKNGVQANFIQKQ